MANTESAVALIGAALERSDHAVFVSADPDGPFRAVNDAACRLLGYSRDELLKLTPSQISARSPDELEAIYSKLQETEYLRRRAWCRRSDGSVVEIGYWGSRTTLESGNFWLTVTDVVDTAHAVTPARDGHDRVRPLVAAAKSLRRRATGRESDERELELLRELLGQRMTDCWERLEDAAIELSALHEVTLDEIVARVVGAVSEDDSRGRPNV